MADGKKASTSGNRYFNRRRSKKPIEIVELSDSSSDSDNDEPSESPPLPAVPTHKSTPVTDSNATMECPVCLQPCIHPARLPCGHVFCFLCLKGIANQSRRCAMCRQEISPDYLDRPDLLESSSPQEEKETETFEGGYQWFYEGRNGWWQFEERLSQELEENRKLGVNTIEILICGSLYIVDLQALVQYNKNNPTRKRRIKRDLITNVVVKGVAGIR